MPRIHIAILTFNNRSMLSDLLRDVEKQTLQPDKVFVVDNASSDGTVDLIKTSFPLVIYERFEENTGSSGGYHRLLKVASQESDFVWTLDDDVRLEPDALENIVRGFDELGKNHRLGAVRSVGTYHTSAQPSRLKIIPWRGSLFPAKIIKEIGLPRKDYFLYGDDFEYSLRLKKNGYVCYWVPSSICSEVRSSNKVQFRIFNRIFAFYATPYRHYYGFRNEVNALLEYGNIQLLLTTLFYALKLISVLMLWHGNGKKEMVKAVVQGIVDGFRGRLGKNLSYIP
jgi:rhamnopyranosyl-N-acetylglucosaminyl-diphospho-decaprenol beta-1,3/1,4-galactofuranosyltransferase